MWSSRRPGSAASAKPQSTGTTRAARIAIWGGLAGSDTCERNDRFYRIRGLVRARASWARGKYIWTVPPLRAASADTTPDVDALRFARYARMSPAEKAARVVDLTQSACTLALAGLRARHPGAREPELLLRLAVLRLGADTVRRAYGWRAPDGS